MKTKDKKKVSNHEPTKFLIMSIPMPVIVEL